MTVEDKKTNAVNRLLDLQEAVIRMFNDSINYEDDEDRTIALNDAIFEHLTTGELNDDYQTYALRGLNVEEKNRILNIVNSYKDIIFYDGDPTCWAESSERFIEDFTMIATEVLDNYDFVIELAKVGGVNTLNFLRELKDQDGYSDYSVVERLRNTFGNDELLEKVLLEMTKDNNLYNIFTTSEKAELLDFPLGVLYFNKDEKTAIISNPLVIAVELYNRANFDDKELTDDNASKLLSDITAYLRDNDFGFSNALGDLYFDYEDNNPIYYVSKIDNIEVDKSGKKTKEMLGRDAKGIVK